MNLRHRAGEPAVAGAFHSWCAELEEVLRVEVRARRVRRTDRVHECDRSLAPKRQERLERRMEAEPRNPEIQETARPCL